MHVGSCTQVRPSSFQNSWRDAVGLNSPASVGSPPPICDLRTVLSPITWASRDRVVLASCHALCIRCSLCNRRQRSINTFASVRVRKPSRLSILSLRMPVRLRAKPFCQGLLGSMKTGPVAASRSQRITLAAENPAPLSERTNAAFSSTATTATASRLRPAPAARADLDRQALSEVLVDHGPYPPTPGYAGPLFRWTRSKDSTLVSIGTRSPRVTNQ